MPTTYPKNLYSPEVYRECLERIEKLTPDSQPQWGKMNVAQMLAHCAEIIEVANGKPLTNTPWYVKFFKGAIRRMVLSDRPYPKSTKTHPQYLQTTDHDFTTEKARLLKALAEYVAKDRETAEQIIHPLLGKMSYEEKGWAMYKHLNHHLEQFGV